MLSNYQFIQHLQTNLLHQFQTEFKLLLLQLLPLCRLLGGCQAQVRPQPIACSWSTRAGLLAVLDAVVCLATGTTSSAAAAIIRSSWRELPPPLHHRQQALHRRKHLHPSLHHQRQPFTILPSAIQFRPRHLRHLHLPYEHILHFHLLLFLLVTMLPHEFVELPLLRLS